MKSLQAAQLAMGIGAARAPEAAVTSVKCPLPSFRNSFETPRCCGTNRSACPRPSKLPKTGAVLLSGDAVHFRDNWDNRRVPSINFSKEQTLASMQKIADRLMKEHAQLWINHDKAQRDGQKMSPEFYD